MLLNTDLRHGESDALAGHLHRFRRAPVGQEKEFTEARRAYEQLSRFVSHNPMIAQDYRRSKERTSALSIEVRKDLVWDLDGALPVTPRPENAARIGHVLSDAVLTFLHEDH